MAAVLGRVALANPAIRQQAMAAAMPRAAAGQAGRSGTQQGMQGMQGAQTEQMLQNMLQSFVPGQSEEAPRYSRRYEDEEYDDEPPRRRSRRRSRRRRDDDDDDEEEDEEEDEDEKEKRKQKQKEKELAHVDKQIKSYYNIDKENAIKFKKAYYEGEKGAITKFGVQIKYNGTDATITRINKKNNKIYSIFIMVGSQGTQLSRNQISIDGVPVYNLSIINMIMERCFNKKEE